MESTAAQIAHQNPYFQVLRDGKIVRLVPHDFVEPSQDPQTGVVSRDVLISPENNISVRIFLPKITETAPKLPLLIYAHGGAFSIGSAFSTMYHRHVNSLASESRSVVVSIEYRLAPEHPIPACYDDCYDVLKWIDSHSRPGTGPDPWINEYTDFDRVFMIGDSAGGNIVHNTAIRARDGLNFRFAGLILVHPFFGIGERDELWDYICPGTPGANDVRLCCVHNYNYKFLKPSELHQNNSLLLGGSTKLAPSRLNPTADLDLLSELGCDRLLVCVGEKDFLRERGRRYYEGLKKSGWKGVVEFFETPGEEHVFHLTNPCCDNASSLMKRIVEFINSGSP